jgi:hypothetical protein
MVVAETWERLWQDIVMLKYVKQYPICLIPNRINDSPLLKNLLKVRHIYLKGRKYKIGNGKMLAFGWISGCIIYPALFELCLNQKSSIFEVASEGWVIKFRCHIHGIIRDQWYELARKLNPVTLSQDRSSYLEPVKKGQIYSKICI